jgi:hypothetical protein
VALSAGCNDANLLRMPLLPFFFIFIKKRMRATLVNQTDTTKQLPSEVSLLLLFSTLFFILPQGKNATCFAFTPSHFPSPSSNCFPFLSRMYIQNAQGNLNVDCPVLYSFSSLFRYLGRFTRGMPSLPQPLQFVPYLSGRRGAKPVEQEQVVKIS